MLERTTVFVDTSYLLASFYNSLEIGARAQLEIDLPEVVATLGSMIENQLGHPVHRQNWYDGIPDTGPHRYQRALRTCNGVQLRTGQLIEWGERRAQKGVDTRLVADMVIAGLNQQVTDFVLVSGDADMIPGVEEAANNGIRVHLYGFGWDSMSSALRHACDTTTILDPREDFADAMKLQLLEGPLPPTIREPRGDDERDDAAGADDTSAPGDAGQDAGQNAGDHAERAKASGATEPYSNTTPEDTHAHDSAKAGANSAEAAQVSADAAQTSAVESSLSREGSRTSAPRRPTWRRTAHRRMTAARIPRGRRSRSLNRPRLRRPRMRRGMLPTIRNLKAPTGPTSLPPPLRARCRRRAAQRAGRNRR